jgi:nucleoside-diphosphate-sugar epimerase
MSEGSETFLVTGAGGFLGRHLVEHLKRSGVRVRAMVRDAGQVADLRSLTDDVVVADICRPETLPPALAGCAGVHHVAAIFRQESVAPEVFHAVNVEGVRNIFEAAIAAGVPRIVHCSTNGVHSHIERPPADETAPFAPGDLYQETKLEGEKIAMRYFAEGRVRGVVIRPTMIYGPGDRRTLKLFRMIARRRFFYVGQGRALTHWVDVRDVAEAFRLAMEASHLNAEAFLIGGRDYQPLSEVVREIAQQLDVPEPRLKLPLGPVMTLAHAMEIVFKPLGIEPPLYRRRVAFFVKDRAYDIGKARRELGYSPRQALRDEIVDIIRAYRESGDLPAPRRARERQAAG